MALDYDTNDHLEYSLLSNNKASDAALKFFEIHSSQGYITLKHYPFNNLISISTSSTTILDFKIRVADSGNPPHQVHIPFSIKLIWTPTIHVPHFSQLHYLFAVLENLSVGKIVGHLKGNESTQSNYFKRNLFKLKITF